MQTSADCVFAIDLRVGHFGFVLIERPNILLDWGVSGYHSSPSEALTRKIAQVAEQFSPSVILCRRTIENGPLLDALERQALAHSIPVHEDRAFHPLAQHFRKGHLYYAPISFCSG